ncbi:MAG TPA: oligoendopeptidase F [Clostridiales bacterium]|nr:oligoendopeptidase F [Clostridiales bacterium]
METDSQPHRRSRAEIPEQDRWKLEDIFPADEAWEASLTAVGPLLEQLLGCRGHLAESKDHLQQALRLSSQVQLELTELLTYARMRRDEDNACARYQEMTDRITAAYYQAEAASAFLMPEIAGLPQDQVLGWLAADPGLAPYWHFLLDVFRTRPHILPEAEEALLAGFGPIDESIGDIFAMLDNVDIKLGSIEDPQGQAIELTHATFARLREHPDRRVRAAAFARTHEAYAGVGRTLGALYATRIKADLMAARARYFPSSLAAALFRNNLPENLYAVLIETVQANRTVLGRYLDLRRRCLDLEDLHFHDAYVPIVSQPERSYSFAEACDLVRQALRPLGGRYLADLERHLDSRWIDVYETPGKTSGAYSWGTYKTHPYILMNYNGTLSDVFTLAHELGHSLHTWYSNQRPYPESHYPIFLAEIASTVNENLLMHFLLQRCDITTAAGRQEKAFLLNHFLEEFRQTVFRQTLFAEFEWQAHRRAEEGEALSSDWLCSLYGDLLQKLYGPEIVPDDYMKWEWARIPHFYQVFYVYQYATGFAAAVALSSRIRDGGQPAVDRYMEFLGAGGSDYPLDILSRAGVDLSTQAPIQAALDQFAVSLAEMARLIEGRLEDGN